MSINIVYDRTLNFSHECNHDHNLRKSTEEHRKEDLLNIERTWNLRLKEAERSKLLLILTQIQCQCVNVFSRVESTCGAFFNSHRNRWVII
jgi:hypothetical protein